MGVFCTHTANSFHTSVSFHIHRNRKVGAISEDMKIDTGMERICCVCAEHRSKNSTSLAITVPRKKLDKYRIRLSIVKNIDGHEYICTTCKLSIEKNKEPMFCT